MSVVGSRLIDGRLGVGLIFGVSLSIGTRSLIGKSIIGGPQKLVDKMLVVDKSVIFRKNKKLTHKNVKYFTSNNKKQFFIIERCHNNYIPVKFMI